MVFGQLHYTKRVVFMPFLVAEILNFQGSAHHVGVGSLSNYLAPYMVPVVSGCMISSTYAPVENATVVTVMEAVGAQFYPWAMLVLIIFAIVTGYGRTFLPDGGVTDTAQ